MYVTTQSLGQDLALIAIFQYLERPQDSWRGTFDKVSEREQVYTEYQEKILYCDSGKALAQVAQKCDCPISGSVQGRAGWGFYQCGLMEGVPGDWSLVTFKVPSKQSVLSTYDFSMKSKGKLCFVACLFILFNYILPPVKTSWRAFAHNSEPTVLCDLLESAPVFMLWI